MQTRFLTQITTTLNPFSLTSKTPRLFLARLPPNIRNTVKVSIKQLPRSSTESSTLVLGFKDGKEMSFVFEEGKEEGGKIGDVVAEVERHCRGLARKEDLAG